MTPRVAHANWHSHEKLLSVQRGNVSAGVGSSRVSGVCVTMLGFAVPVHVMMPMQLQCELVNAFSHQYCSRAVAPTHPDGVICWWW